MAISHSWLNQGVAAILAGIQGLEINASGGSGGFAPKYVVSARVKLKQGEAKVLIPGTSETIYRQIAVKLISGNRVSLFWEGMGSGEIDFQQLTPHYPLYKDNTDGGIRLDALAVEGDAEVVVIIRQQEPITYIIGENSMANVSVSLWVSTDIYYSDSVYDSDVVEKIDNFAGSDDYLSGYKIFIINGFAPGEKTTFNIDAASAGYGGTDVEMQLIKPFELMFFLFQTGINEHLWESLPDFLSSPEGFGKIFRYGAKTATSTGGELIIKPKFDMFAGRFVAVNSFSGVRDTCIITDYAPNTGDPKQGGTFTLGGF